MHIVHAWSLQLYVPGACKIFLLTSFNPTQAKGEGFYIIIKCQIMRFAKLQLQLFSPTHLQLTIKLIWTTELFRLHPFNPK